MKAILTAALLLALPFSYAHAKTYQQILDSVPKTIYSQIPDEPGCLHYHWEEIDFINTKVCDPGGDTPVYKTCTEWDHPNFPSNCYNWNLIRAADGQIITEHE